MNPDHTDIMDLVPQRPPMVMLDRLLFCQGAIARGTLMIRDENVFVREGMLTECGMIEAMAQTAAARTGWMCRIKQGNDQKASPIGVIGLIKDFRLSFLPRTGQEIETEIEMTHEFMNASVIFGKVSVNGAEACRTEMRIFLS